MAKLGSTMHQSGINDHSCLAGEKWTIHDHPFKSFHIWSLILWTAGSRQVVI